MPEPTPAPGPPTSAGAAAAAAPGGIGIGGWLPWVALLVVGTVTGAILGVAGVAGRPTDHRTVANSGVLIGMDVAGRACPGGPVVAQLTPGSRVLALARSDDGSAVQVRNPADTRVAVWIPTSELVSDAGEPAIESLPVGEACPTVSAPQPVVAPPVVAPPAPTPPKPNPPAPAPDTTKPTFGSINVSMPNGCQAVVTANVTDNVGVVSVTLKWDHPANSIAAMDGGGTTWTKSITVPTNTVGVVNLALAARDAAGNTAITNSTFTANCPVG